MPYAGPDPDGFMPREQVVGYVQDYAAFIGAPVRLGTGIDRAGDAGAGRAGDEVVAVVPVWPNLTAQPAILGAHVTRVACALAHGAWRLDLDALRASSRSDPRAAGQLARTTRPAGR